MLSLKEIRDSANAALQVMEMASLNVAGGSIADSGKNSSIFKAGVSGMHHQSNNVAGDLTDRNRLKP